MTTRQAFWFNVRFFAGFWRPELWRNYPKSDHPLTITPEEHASDDLLQGH